MRQVIMFNNKNYSLPKIDPLKVFYFNAIQNSTIGLSKKSSYQTLEYSTDYSNWNTMTTSTSINLNAGDKLYVRGILSGDNTESNSTRFTITGNVSAVGKLNYIWNYLDTNAALKACCGTELFRDCKGLQDVSKLLLPSTTLSYRCYGGMFTESGIRTVVPNLPATTLSGSCYIGMYSRCYSITSIPENYLSAATNLNVEYAYCYLFTGCTGLTTIPLNILPATGTIGPNVYRRMFYQCSNLENAPELPATTLGQEAYVEMFNGCSKLSYIKCLATTGINTTNLNGWVNGVAATGTFVKKSGVSWPSGTSGIPSGWTVQDYQS